MHTRKGKPGSTAWYVCNWLRLLANTAVVALIFIVAMTQIPLLEKNAFLFVSFWLCLIVMIIMVLLFFKLRVLCGAIVSKVVQKHILNLCKYPSEGIILSPIGLVLSGRHSITEHDFVVIHP